MSLNLYIALDPEILHLNPNAADHVVLAEYGADLDRLDESWGVAPLSSFYSYSFDDVADLLDEDMQADTASAAYRVVWSEPQAGLASVNTLQDRLQAFSDTLPFDRNQALAELADLAHILAEAVNSGAKFRLYTAF